MLQNDKFNFIKEFFFLIILMHVVLLSHSQTKLLIDPRYVRGGGISELVDEVSFIPFETSKESTFGIAQKIRTSRNHFVFYDFTTNAIFLFYKNGKFHCKIADLPGLNKEETRQLYSLENFVVNPYSENVYVVYDSGDDLHAKKLAVFNTDGKLIQSKLLNGSFNNLSTSFVFLDSTTTLFANRRGKISSKYYFHTVKDFEKTIKDNVEISPTDLFNNSWANDYILQSISSKGSLWSRQYDDLVYFFDKNVKEKTYKFLLPSNLNLDADFYKDTSIIGNRMKSNDYLSEHKDRVSFLGNIQNVNDWMSFTLIKYNMAGPNDVYLYNLKNNALFSFGKISPDSLSYSIPIFKVGALVVGSEGDYLYISIPSFSFYNAIKNSTNKKWEGNEVLSNYFKTQNQKSNPVLVRLKLKKN